MTRITIELDDQLYQTLRSKVGEEHIGQYLCLLAEQQNQTTMSPAISPFAALKQWRTNNILNDEDNPFDHTRERHDRPATDWTNPC